MASRLQTISRLCVAFMLLLFFTSCLHAQANSEKLKTMRRNHGKRAHQAQRLHDKSKNKAGESESEPKYEFEAIHQVGCTPVKSQERTGTCWSFATASFIESELLRRGHNELDLSEMFIVRNIYREKAHNYILRKGKTNFSQGALAHDFLNSAAKYGMIPEAAYSGRKQKELPHNHGELESVLKGMLDSLIDQKQLSPYWPRAIDAVLDAYLGKPPKRFKFDGKGMTPQKFSDHVGFDRDDYISITSFSHHPFYEEFVLELPDNFSNGSFYNLPIKDLMSIVDNALKNGYSVAWDGDVSEQGFSASHGLAVLPKNPNRKDLFSKPGAERKVTQAMRQQTFLAYSTTDDHLMHLVGSAKDSRGQKYYVIKNSWGEIGPHKGLVYMSEAYAKAKVIAIIVHRDAIPKRLQP